MDWWEWLATEYLWRNAVAVVPLAVLAAVVCRWVPCRPTTRHSLWLIVLLWFVAAPLLPNLPIPAPTLSNPPTDQEVGGVGNEADGRRALPPHPVGRHDGWTDNYDDSWDAGSETATGPAEPGHPTVLASPSTTLRFAKDGAPLRSCGLTEPSAGRAELWAPLPDGRGSENAYFETRKTRADDALGASEPSHFSVLAGPSPTLRLAKDGAPLPSADSGPVTEQADAALAWASETDNEDEFVAGPARTGRPGEWRRWLAGVVAVRDAVGRLPSFLSRIWLPGIGLFVLVCTVGIARYRRGIRGARPAPASVTEMVSGAAKELGLRRVPETFMLANRSSPMIWCGLRSRLILPAELWLQLDHAGRRAVIVHELAHLARRDHWVCWLELVVCSLYWWHPLVWWVRHRLHEEADECCDAWVTWLMPGGRRAYAEALLTTKQYVSVGALAVPSVGMGVVTGRTRRLARRITMVMTANAVPKHSVTGVALAASLVLAGWLATPAQTDASVAGAVGVSLVLDSVESADPAGQSDADVVASVAMVVPGGEAVGLQGRLARLEGQMDLVAEQISRMTTAARSAERFPVEYRMPGPRYSREQQTARIGEIYAMRAALQASAGRAGRQARECDRQADALAYRARSLELEADALASDAELLGTEAASLAERAMARQEKAVALSGRERASVMVESRCLAGRAVTLEEKARMVEVLARLLEEQARALDQQVEAFQTQAEVLDLQEETLAEQLEAVQYRIAAGY